jgi:hypothetical protein
MAIQQVARAVSLAWTAVSGQNPTPPTGPLTNIQSYSTTNADELEKFRKGNARVPTSYQGLSAGSITVETGDVGVWALFKKGQRYNNVILTIEGAKDSSGASVGDNVTITLSEAVISEVGELAHGNENSAPVVASVTFELDRHPASSADPTMVLAVSA